MRRVRTASGATAVQIAEYVHGRRRIVAHVGSAHTEAELGLLVERARALLQDAGQDAFDLGVEATPVKAELVSSTPNAGLFAEQEPQVAPLRVAAPRVVDTPSRLLFEVLAEVYAALGFAVVGDEVFRDLVIARIVEPTSILDTGRVLTDLGRRPASERTMRRTLDRAQQGGYREKIATACFTHAVTGGDVSLCLYDVTVRHEALVVRVEVRDHHRGSGRSWGREAGGSLTGETSGRVGAALTELPRVFRTPACWVFRLLLVSGSTRP